MDKNDLDIQFVETPSDASADITPPETVSDGKDNRSSKKKRYIVGAIVGLIAACIILYFATGQNDILKRYVRYANAHCDEHYSIVLCSDYLDDEEKSDGYYYLCYDGEIEAYIYKDQSFIYGDDPNAKKVVIKLSSPESITACSLFVGFLRHSSDNELDAIYDELLDKAIACLNKGDLFNGYYRLDYAIDDTHNCSLLTSGTDGLCFEYELTQ